jgi:hypothetical protein
MSSNWWSASGLAVDFVGVLLLGVDLIRLQTRIKQAAAASRRTLDGLTQDYGGTQSWAEEIRTSAKWVPASAYSDHHAQDELSYNAERALERIGEVASCTEGLAAHIATITTFLDEDAAEHERTAATSFFFSVAGLVMIIVGFGLQFVGSWPL